MFQTPKYQFFSACGAVKKLKKSKKYPKKNKFSGKIKFTFSKKFPTSYGYDSKRVFKFMQPKEISFCR